MTGLRQTYQVSLRYLRVLSCDDPDDIASETWLQVVRDLHERDNDDGAASSG